MLEIRSTHPRDSITQSVGVCFGYMDFMKTSWVTRFSTALVVAMTLLAFSGGLAAQEARAPEDTSHRTAASFGIGFGTLLEVLGYGGATVGMIMLAAGRDEGGIFTTTVSGGVVTAGALASTISYSVRHAAYEKAGFRPRPRMAGLTWAFTSVTTAAYAVSLVGYFEAMEPREDLGVSAGYGLLWLATTGICVIMDIFNLSFSRFRWRRDMMRQEEAGEPWVSVAPLVNVAGLAVVGGF